MASPLIEKELKYAVSHDHYLRLLRHFKTQTKKTLLLENYYFDDEKLSLNKAKFGLRVRLTNGRRPLLTLKYPAKTLTGSLRALKIRHEYETRLPLKVARSLLRKEKNILDLEVAPIKTLRRRFYKRALPAIGPIGVLETKRTTVPMEDSGFILEVDACRFFGKRFFEVEVETSTPKRADKAVRNLFQDHGVPYRPLMKSKLERFIQEWKKT